MKLISSKVTFFQKRVFPAIWFGFLGLGQVAMVLGTMLKREFPNPLIFVPTAMAVFGYVLFRWLAFDLVDEVFDLGDSLLVRNRGREAKIQLSDIINVNASMFQNPPRITLTLREPCELGKEIAFMVPHRFSLNPLSRSPLAMELIERIDALRQFRR